MSYLTSHLVQVSDYMSTLGISESSAIPVAMIGAILIWVLLLFLLWLGIFIVSCFKHKLSLNDISSVTFANYSLTFKDFFKPILPMIFFMVIASAAGIAEFIVSLSESGSAAATGFSLVMNVCLLIYGIYYSIFEYSLLKSYYSFKKGGKFTFSWISFSQFIKIIGLSLLLIIPLLATGLLAFFPLIPLSFMLLFMEFPIIINNLGIKESIKKGWRVAKANYWEVVFFYCIISLLVGFIGGFINVFSPFTMIIYMAATAFVLRPVTTIWLAELYMKLEREKPVPGPLDIPPAEEDNGKMVIESTKKKTPVRRAAAKRPATPRKVASRPTSAKASRQKK